MADASSRAKFISSIIPLVLIILILPQSVSTALHFELIRNLTLVLESFYQFDWCTCRFFGFNFWFSATTAMVRSLIWTTFCNISDIGYWLGPLNIIAYIYFVIKLNGRFLMTYCRWLFDLNSVSFVFFYADQGVCATFYQRASTHWIEQNFVIDYQCHSTWPTPHFDLANPPSCLTDLRFSCSVLDYLLIKGFSCNLLSNLFLKRCFLSIILFVYWLFHWLRQF